LSFMIEFSQKTFFLLYVPQLQFLAGIQTMSRTRDDRYTCGENTREKKPGPFSPHLQMLLFISIHYSDRFVKNYCHRPSFNHISGNNYRTLPDSLAPIDRRGTARELPCPPGYRNLLRSKSRFSSPFPHLVRRLRASDRTHWLLSLRPLPGQATAKQHTHILLVRYFVKHILKYGPKSMDFLW